MCHLAPQWPGNWLQASEDIAESMKMLAASKKKCPNCRAGTTRRRIKRLYAPQFVHHSEIIVLLRSVAVQAAKQIYDIITQTKDKQALHLEHTNRLSKGPGGLQIKKKNLSSVSMVTEQSRPTYSFSLVSQHYSFRKLTKLVWGFVFLTMSECIYLWNGKRKANIFFAKQSQWNVWQSEL